MYENWLVCRACTHTIQLFYEGFLHCTSIKQNQGTHSAQKGVVGTSPTSQGCYVPSSPNLQIPFSVPEVPLVFQGQTKQGRQVPKFVVSNLKVCCPLPEGSALVTFEDPKVVDRLLQQKEHRVNLEDCWLRVQVQPLELPVVTNIQVSSQPDNHRVLVSGFPAGLRLSEEELLDKLEIFFGKAKNGGGDVETREMLQGTVMLGFADEEVAQHLCQIGQFRVPLDRQQVLLRVSPYVSGEIQKAEVREGGAGEASPCRGELRAPQPLQPTQEPELPDPSHVFCGMVLVPASARHCPAFP